MQVMLGIFSAFFRSSLKYSGSGSNEKILLSGKKKFANNDQDPSFAPASTMHLMLDSCLISFRKSYVLICVSLKDLAQVFFRENTLRFFEIASNNRSESKNGL